jgi:hypothetical protein
MSFPMPFFIPKRTPQWMTAFQATFASNSMDGTYTFTVRQVLNSSVWLAGNGGTKARFTFQSNTAGGSLVLSAAYFGQQAGSGDVYDFATTPSQILFSGSGSGTVSSGGATLLSDELVLSFDTSKNYVLSMDQGNTAGQGSPGAEVTHSGASVYTKIADDGATVDASGYSLNGSVAVSGIAKIEVFA